MENLNIIHEPEKQRFILTIQDETAHVAYRIENGASISVIPLFLLRLKGKGLLQLW